ncbi:cytochrome P460 family protein [Methanolobus profundi]|uniref:Cytochrome P460 n=1 Tax=Methanolobus profundi TaxID=487685 RepID=A0A1I4QNH8_9EURY|nr:cytochrome P460 family protein [Methanolobus profundi]SFM41265.1 Cytochrome P460 [Methanolobus profundi]
MIKKLILLLIICVIGISGCADTATDEGTMAEDTGADDAMQAEDMEEDMVEEESMTPDAADLFSMFAEEDSYKEWSIWPGEVAMMDGNGVHGDFVSIYVSDNAVSAAETGGEIMPYGTMVVKEGFDSDKELTGIYLMYKAEDFDPDNNDWFWAAYSPDGVVKSEGKLGGCIGCHEGKAEADYIFTNA